MTTRLHAPSGLALSTSLCGRMASTITTDGAEVTCKDCLRLLTAKPKPRKVSWEEAVRAAAHLLAGPPVTPQPSITPALWASMDCRRGVLDDGHIQALRMTPAAWLERGGTGLRCQCEVCRTEENNTAARIQWDEEQQARPHRRYDCDFGSLNAALDLLASWRADGPSVRSAFGSMQSRAQESARLGTQVQTTRRVDRDSLEIRRAGQVRDIEKALTRAFVEEQSRRGLEREACVAIVLSVARGADVDWWATRTGLTARAIKSLVAHGKRLASIELAARGVIPWPRDRNGMHAAIAARVEEMAGRAA